jgi:hypothetical protein
MDLSGGIIRPFRQALFRQGNDLFGRWAEHPGFGLGRHNLFVTN